MCRPTAGPGDDGIRILMIYGGPTAPSDIDYDAPEGELATDAPLASSIEMWDAENIPFHDPAQNFFHLSARWLVDDETLGSEAIVVGQSSFEAERGAHELHRHLPAGELLFLLAGNGFHVNPDGSELEVRPGDLTFVAPNKWHGFRNRSDETALAILGYLGAGSPTAGGYELPESVAAGSA